jgi:hypothetical protein
MSIGKAGQCAPIAILGVNALAERVIYFGFAIDTSDGGEWGLELDRFDI